LLSEIKWEGVATDFVVGLYIPQKVIACFENARHSRITIDDSSLPFLRVASDMATLTILIFLLAGCCFALLNRSKTTNVIIASILICFEAIGSGLVPKLLTENLQSEYSFPDSFNWGKRNAIVLLGAGTVKWPNQADVEPTVLAYSRILGALRLYLLCKKNNDQCSIIISGGDASGTGITEAESYRSVLLGLGVEDSDVVLEKQSLNTFRNAEFTSGLLKTGQFDRVFLVTSGLHLFRAILYFAHFGISVTPIPADRISPQVSIIPSGYNFAIADLAAHEYIGIARYYVYNFLGRNPPATRPGSP
jgi:uncharacterized SAM-binding protein YcdF (DUF218 family)